MLAGAAAQPLDTELGPPPLAYPPNDLDMSEALDRIRDLIQAGFAFMLHRDDNEEAVTLQAIRTHAGHIDTVLIHREHDALAARCRDEPRAAVVWYQSGPTAEAITALLALPEPGTHGAPTLARPALSELWIPFAGR